jgi:hypothetical protein
LREQLGERRLRFNDDQRRRLASKAKGLGRKILKEVATLVAPETLIAWHRKLIAQKYDVTDKAPDGATQTMALTEAGAIVGTAAYMSPEQAKART